MNSSTWQRFNQEFAILQQHVRNNTEGNQAAEVLYYQLKAEMAYYVRLHRVEIRELLKRIPNSFSPDGVCQLTAFFKSLPNFDNGYAWDNDNRSNLLMKLHMLDSREELEVVVKYYHIRQLLAVFLPVEESVEWINDLIDEIPWSYSKESVLQLKTYLNFIVPTGWEQLKTASIS